MIELRRSLMNDLEELNKLMEESLYILNSNKCTLLKQKTLLIEKITKAELKSKELALKIIDIEKVVCNDRLQRR